MASTRRKSAAIALAVVGIAGLSLASASTLSLTGDTLQAGTTDLVDCQSGAVTVAFTPDTFVATGYTTSEVNLTGITAPGCVGKDVRVALLDSDGDLITESAITEITGATMDVTVAETDAASIESVAVVISG